MDAYVTEPTARNTLVAALAVWLLLLTTGIALLAGTGIRINLSSSMPVGFYRLTAASIERGALVVACPDMTHPALQRAYERGYLPPGWGCDGGIAPLLKRVLALPGDWVAIHEDGITVNGQLIANSAWLEVDQLGRPMPPLPATGAVPAGYVWLFSDHAPESFDSRYFGPVALSAIIGTARLVTF